MTGATLYRNAEDFCAAEIGDQTTIRDGYGRLWLAWETEAGDRWAVRPRDEDDVAHSADDPWRPVGPERIEHLPLPWLVQVPAYQSDDEIEQARR